MRCRNECGELSAPWTENGLEWFRSCERCGTLERIAVARCRSCSAPIRWLTSDAGRPFPVDVDPVDTGNVLEAWIGGEAIAVVLSAGELEGARIAGRELLVSHFATCPNAATHRKARP